MTAEPDNLAPICPSGTLIRMARRKRNLTRTELSDLSGVSKETIQGFELDKDVWDDLPAFLALCRVFNATKEEE